MMSSVPFLGAYPYAGTSGFADGSETSHDRAVANDVNGVTARRQRAVLRFLAVVGPAGMTVRELSDLTGWHHGQASAALSTLHRVARVSRLAESRHGCRVYVLPTEVGERPTEARGRQHGRNRCPHCGGTL